MAKNKALIEQYKRLATKVNQITPEVYSAIALSLHRKFGWEYEQISELFAESQIIWNECVNSCDNMVDMCYVERELMSDTKLGKRVIRWLTKECLA